MRVRILKSSTGIVDGVSLSRLQPAFVYEVPVSLGTWLISQGAAEEDVSGAIPESLEHTSASVTGGVTVSITYQTPRLPEET